MSSLTLFLLFATLASAAPAAGMARHVPQEFNSFHEIQPLFDNADLRFFEINGTFSMWDVQNEVVVTSASAAYNAALHKALYDGGCIADAERSMRNAGEGNERRGRDGGDDRFPGYPPRPVPPQLLCGKHRCQTPGLPGICMYYNECAVCSSRTSYCI